MNVFDTIKNKITSVPQNISAGIKSFTSRDESSVENYHCDDVNVHAGAELLNKFQDYWSAIHQDAEINAQKAEGVDSVINQLYLQIEKENDNMTNILREASYLPELALSLKATMELISEIDSKATELESMLVGLHDLCEEGEMKRNRALHLNELKLYKHRKEVEIEQVKAKLARQHASKVAAHEVKLQENLREKHSIFEETYNKAIEEYKVFGQTQLKRPGYMNQSSGTQDLSNISLDQDSADLESFLDTSDNVQGACKEEKDLDTAGGGDKADDKAEDTVHEKSDAEQSSEIEQIASSESEHGKTETVDGETEASPVVVTDTAQTNIANTDVVQSHSTNTQGDEEDKKDAAPEKDAVTEEETVIEKETVTDKDAITTNNNIDSENTNSPG